MNKLAAETLARIMRVEQATKERRDDILKKNEINLSIKYVVELVERYHHEANNKPCDMVAFFFTTQGLFPIVTGEAQDFWDYTTSATSNALYEFEEGLFNDWNDLSDSMKEVYNDYPMYYFSFPFVLMTADQIIDDEEFCRMVKSILDLPCSYNDCMHSVHGENVPTPCTRRYGLLIHMGTKAVTSFTGKGDLKDKLEEISRLYPELTFDEES